MKHNLTNAQESYTTKLRRKFNRQWFDKGLLLGFIDPNDENVKIVLSAENKTSDKYLSNLYAIVRNTPLPYEEVVAIYDGFIKEFRENSFCDSKDIATSRVSFMQEAMSILQGWAVSIGIDDASQGKLEAEGTPYNENAINHIQASQDITACDIEKFMYDLYDYAFVPGPITREQAQRESTVPSSAKAIKIKRYTAKTK